MNKLVLGLAALPFLAGAASAGQPLSDAQMDGTTAGRRAVPFQLTATSLEIRWAVPSGSPQPFYWFGGSGWQSYLIPFTGSASGPPSVFPSSTHLNLGTAADRARWLDLRLRGDLAGSKCLVVGLNSGAKRSQRTR